MKTNEIDYELTERAYSRGAHKPAWFDNHKGLTFKCVSGSSPNNEWYAFQNEQEAQEMLIQHGGSHQTYIDQFVAIHHGEGWTHYHVEDCTWNEDTEEYDVKEGAEPASLQDVFWSQSAF